MPHGKNIMSEQQLEDHWGSDLIYFNNPWL